MRCLIIVMGLPGAGKSTVLSVAQQKGWTVLNYGTKMFEIAKELYGIEHRDELRKLPAEKQKNVQSKVGEELAAVLERNVILDTHCSINTPNGYLPGLPYSIISKLNVERLVLVTAPIDDIMQRRNSDKSRVRDAQSEASLSEHDDMNRNYLATYSVICGASAIILQNANGKLQQTQAQFAQLLE